MFFSVFNYFTKTKKRNLLEQSLTKNFVEKIIDTTLLLMAICKNKLIRSVAGSVSSVSPCDKVKVVL